jgi:hypothetical protein
MLIALSESYLYLLIIIRALLRSVGDRLWETGVQLSFLIFITANNYQVQISFDRLCKLLI